jgi:hypothetical protein
VPALLPTLEVGLAPATVAAVWAAPFGGEGHVHTEERDFEHAEGGNRVVYLNQFLQAVLPEVFWKLRSTAQAAVAAGKAVGRFPDTGRDRPPAELGVRCVELLQYSSGDGFTSSLGWHEDVDSVYTMVVSLSQPGRDFQGGTFRIVQNGARSGDPSEHEQHHALDLGEGAGVVFASERTHGVASLHEGVRTVLVLEFWPMGDGTSGDLRPGVQFGQPQPAFPAEPPAGCARGGGVYQPGCWGA